MQRTTFLTALFLFSLNACAAKTLDGGSTGDTKGAGTGAESGENGAGNTNGADGEIADAPVVGNIAGQTFELKNADVTFSKRNNQWFLSLDNYANDCGSMGSTRPDGAESMTINVGGLAPEAGTFTIKYGDGHGATLQYGVFEASDTRKPDTRVVQTGTLRLDNWDETPGATITGGLKLVADDMSAVAGTFTAKVCPAR
jgi:hypothetical protein